MKAIQKRSNGKSKDIAAPLLDLTNRLAAAIPRLASPTLARAVTHLLVAALLRAYQHGARAARRAVEARGSIDPDELARRAELSRERARATDHSVRLFLQHVHKLYELSGASQTFVRLLRRYPLSVLREAEQVLAQRLLADHLEPIRCRATYYAAVVRKCFEHYQARRRQNRQDRETLAAIERANAKHQASEAQFRQHPSHWLRAGLERLACQWQSNLHRLQYGGEGLGMATTRNAIAYLVRMYGNAAYDVAHGVMHDFRLTYLDRLGPDGVAAVLRIPERILSNLAPTRNCPPNSAPAMLLAAGKKPRPPPPFPLRSQAARRGRSSQLARVARATGLRPENS